VGIGHNAPPNPLTVLEPTDGAGTIASFFGRSQATGYNAVEIKHNWGRGILSLQEYTTPKVYISSWETSYFMGGCVGIGTTSPGYTLQVVGSFGATSKSFIIDHPTKPDKKLQYGSLEGPEHSVYLRGRSQYKIIDLPDYWPELVHEESITVQLTPVGYHQHLYVERIRDNKVQINTRDKLERRVDYFYNIYAERKDVAKLEVEIDK